MDSDTLAFGFNYTNIWCQHKPEYVLVSEKIVTYSGILRSRSVILLKQKNIWYLCVLKKICQDINEAVPIYHRFKWLYKKLRDMRVMPVIIGTLVTVPEMLKARLEELTIQGQIKILYSSSWLYKDGVMEIWWKDLLSFNSQ